METVNIKMSSMWSIVQIILIVLKASGILTAPWWVILIPVWLTLGGIALGLGVVAAMSIVAWRNDKDDHTGV
mgnify:CR=1 FL=1